LKKELNKMRTINELRVLQLEAKQKEEKESLGELAPEMLERLKRIVELQENKKLQDAYIRNMITSTIAKAEGHE